MAEQKPNVEVSIRLFEPGDQERVEWLFARTPPWGRTYPTPEPLPVDLEDIPHNYPGSCFVATEVDRRGEAIIGLAAVARASMNGSDLPEFVGDRSTTAVLRWVSVVPERWRLGVGRILTERALEWSREQRLTGLVLNTTVQQKGAIEFYRSMGFEELEHTMQGQWDLVWFKRPL